MLTLQKQLDGINNNIQGKKSIYLCIYLFIFLCADHKQSASTTADSAGESLLVQF